MTIKAIEACRVCGSRNLIPVLSLGEQYTVNFLEKPSKDAFKAPLDLVLCNVKDGGCGLLQLKHTVSRDILYKKYWYRSGISTTMIAALTDIVNKAEKLVPLSPNDIVIDIGCNDGTLLRAFKSKNIKLVGFEPSNLFELAVPGATKIFHDYFNYEAFQKEFGKAKAKIITAIAMFYDLDDPNTFVHDVVQCLDDDGIFIIQMNYLPSMLENNAFDNISHEHLEYYSLMSLENLLKKHDLEVFDVELNDVNGGSIRTYIKHKDGKVKPFQGATRRVRELREFERKLGLDKLEIYSQFAKRINNLKDKLVNFLREETRKGKTIYIYGASTRGTVVVQFCGIDYPLVKKAVDKNPEKWGKHIVGTSIPIIPVEQYRKEKPDYLWLLPWQFLKEIENQEKEFLDNGGKIIVAMPQFRVIDKDHL